MDDAPAVTRLRESREAMNLSLLEKGIEGPLCPLDSSREGIVGSHLRSQETFRDIEKDMCRHPNYAAFPGH